MKVMDIAEKLEMHSPQIAACEWDNVGLLVGSYEAPVRRIYIALDATDDVVLDAIDKGCDMLITHHPLIFLGMRSVTESDFIGRRIIAMIENNISYYAMHTNFDVYGMGAICAERFGLPDATPLDQSLGEEGMGRIGNLNNPTTLRRIARDVKAKFNLEDVRVYGDLNRKIQKVAIMPGSGKDELYMAIAEGADVIITGDIGHHSGIDAVAQGLCVVDAGHYGLEHVFIEYIANYLSNLEGVEIFTEKIKNPYTTL